MPNRGDATGADAHTGAVPRASGWSLAREDQFDGFGRFGLLVGNGQFCGHDTAASGAGYAATGVPQHAPLLLGLEWPQAVST